jgi:hypothetical protein
MEWGKAALVLLETQEEDTNPQDFQMEFQCFPSNQLDSKL